ncbi:hypothetical protein SASPL_135307 [Salvia splendens]|uniref:Glucose-methanol-choline oxidoreductase N-terminal domain-containing protein n=1 Tax=Salvia splendens TaxID=180675 RepID=A0A8X8WXX2_SALSN|nr:hypothetical protein SASPL_135307 [Salvia splendens]
MVKRGLPKGLLIVSLVLKCLSSRVGTFLLCGWTDDNSNNPAWKAIGYEVEAVERRIKHEKGRPLAEGIVDTVNLDERSLKESLIRKGIGVVEDLEENVFTIKCDVVIVGSGSGGGVAAAALAKSGQKVVVLEKEDRCDRILHRRRVPKSSAGTGCENLGLKVEPVPRNFSADHYCGSCCYGCRRGDKKGTESTWLVDAVNNGAVILTGCKADTFVLVRDSSEKSRKRCIGVIATAANKNIGRKLRIEARATVSACGSLLTPPLLVASGLENKNIGRNLHLHLVSFVWGYFPESQVELKGKSFEGGITTSIHKVRDEEESSSRAIVEAASIGPASFASLFPWVSRHGMKERMTRYARTAVLFALPRDVGSGSVIKQGHISYRLSEIDKENLKTGLRRALRILIAAGAAEVGTFRSDGQKMRFKDEEGVEEFLDSVTAPGGPMSRSEQWTVYCSAHQMSSCRMGGKGGGGGRSSRRKRGVLGGKGTICV